jgi:hypothetical protein
MQIYTFVYIELEKEMNGYPVIFLIYTAVILTLWVLFLLQASFMV